jgi:hypothetical protein
MKINYSAILAALLLSAAPVWPQQTQQTPAVPAPAVTSPLSFGGANPDLDADVMLTPPPVSGEVFPGSFTSEERENYVRGGVTFNTAYSDNVLGATSATPVSDISYSLWPRITVDQTLSRLRWALSYAPGFTFYQRTGSRNESDQNLAVDMQYRLSPHVTFSLRDSLQKSSNVFNQPDQGLAGAVSGSSQLVNNSVFAPLADRLSNNGIVGLTYQFGPNSMVGGTGSFTNLHYPNPAEVPGLYDAASRSGSGFYTYRLARRHYAGFTYQFQQLLTYPAAGINQTETHAALMFYTYYPSPAVSLSVFGGPQYYSAGAQFSTVTLSLVPPSQAWVPAAGASLNWQSRRTTTALSYSRSVSSGGGLIGAVELDNANGMVRQEITRKFSAAFSAYYANNGVLALSALGGHSIAGSVSLERRLGEHVTMQAGYTRLHQNYSFISANPETNREWASITYQFDRPLGR